MGDEQLKAFYFGGGDLSSLSDADISRLTELMRTTAPTQLPPGFRVLAPPAGPPSTSPYPTGDAAEFGRDLATAGTYGLELGAGLASGGASIPIQLATALGSGLVSGGLRGLINDSPDPINEAATGGVGNVALQAGGEAVKYAAPRAMLPLSILLSGAKSAFPKQAPTLSELVEPFLRRFEQTGQGITVGNVRGARNARMALNPALERVESSVGGEPLSTRSLAGATRDLVQDAKVNTPFPADTRRALRGAEGRIVRQHVNEGAGTIVPRVRMRQLGPQQVANPYTTAPTPVPSHATPSMTPTTPSTSNVLAPGTALGPPRSNVPGFPIEPELRSVGGGMTPAAASVQAAPSTVSVPNVATVPGQRVPVLAGADRMKSPRQGYELARGLRKDARSVIKARQGQEFMTASDQAPEQAKLAIADRIDEILAPIMASHPSTTGAYTSAGAERDAILQQLADLYKQEEISSAVRGGGGVISDIGKMGARGGAASGITRNILTATSAANPPLAGVVPLLSMGLLSPQAISKLGYMGAQAGDVAPDIVRLMQALYELGLPTSIDPVPSHTR